jgi:hypothetical protein
MNRPTNTEIAGALERVAELLEAQGANPYRVQAYRVAGGAVRRCQPPLAAVLGQQGPPGVQEALGVGPALASVIQELLETGRLAMLDRLEGEVSPEGLFMTIPGMGEALARRAHTMLRLETLEDLEAAAHDGRLERLPGFGPRRAQLVREAVGGRLAGSRRRWSARAATERPDPFPPPGVELLLGIDAEYRRRAAAGELRRIRPRRFNPSNEAWLPIWHTERDGWSFTALFSNTARAHDLGMTSTWVVIYFERDGHEGQATVVTASRGLLAGLRVVRGREKQCEASHDALHRASAPRRPDAPGPPVAAAGAQEELGL